MNISHEKIVKTQNIVQVGRKQFAVNNKGYLVNFLDWDKSFAKAMAKKDALELTKCHWAAINFHRDFYREFEVPPSPRTVIKKIGNKFNSGKCTHKDVKKAFPLGGCKQTCIIAGLPRHYNHSG